MGFFGAVFATLTLYREWHIGGILLGVPFLIFAIIAVVASNTIRLPGAPNVTSKSVGRALMWSSAAEGFGIFLGINVVNNLHQPDLLLPMMALVVGLHFLPIAYAGSFRYFYVLGAVLIVSAAIGLIVGAPIGASIAGFAAALGLWVAAVNAVRRERVFKKNSRVAAPI